MQHYKLDINVKGRIVSEAKLLESVEICAAKPDSPLRDLLGSILGRQQPFLLNKHQEVALSGNLERNGCLFKEIKVSPPCGISSSWLSARAGPLSPACLSASQVPKLSEPPPAIFFIYKTIFIRPKCIS